MDEGHRGGVVIAELAKGSFLSGMLIRMDFGLVFAQIFLFLEPLVALFTLERLFKLFKEPPPAFLSRVYHGVLVIDIYHDNGTLPFSFIYFK